MSAVIVWIKYLTTSSIIMLYLHSYSTCLSQLFLMDFLASKFMLLLITVVNDISHTTMNVLLCSESVARERLIKPVTHVNM